jgi:hypothetical protein
MSDKLQFVVRIREMKLSPAFDKLKFVGHSKVMI